VDVLTKVNLFKSYCILVCMAVSYGCLFRSLWEILSYSSAFLTFFGQLRRAVIAAFCGLTGMCIYSGIVMY